MSNEICLSSMRFCTLLKRGYKTPSSDSLSTDQYSEQGYDIGLFRNSRVSSTRAHSSPKHLWTDDLPENNAGCGHSEKNLPFINLNGIISYQPRNPSHVMSAKFPGSSTREIERYISITSPCSSCMIRLRMTLHVQPRQWRNTPPDRSLGLKDCTQIQWIYQEIQNGSSLILDSRRGQHPPIFLATKVRVRCFRTNPIREGPNFQRRVMPRRGFSGKLSVANLNELGYILG